MTMPQINLSRADEATLDRVDAHVNRQVTDVFGGSDRALAAVTWAQRNLPSDEANLLIARMGDPNDGANAAAELRDLHASAARDATVNASVNAGGLRPEEVKAAMNRAAAGDALATRKLKATPMSVIDEGLGINPDACCPTGMCTI